MSMTNIDAQRAVLANRADPAAVLRVLAEYMGEQQAYWQEQAGDSPASFDEVEADGAAMAWGEAQGLVMFALDFPFMTKTTTTEA